MNARMSAPLRRAIALRTPKGRQKHRRFLIEGLRAVGDALERSELVREVLISEELVTQNLATMVQWCEARALPLHCLTAAEFRRLSAVINDQGVVAVAQMPPEPDPQAPLLPGGDQVGLALDGVSDPGNLGTLLRTAEAAGCAAVLRTPGTGDLHNPKIVRAAFGAMLTLPARTLEPQALVDKARAEGISLVLLDARGECTLEEFRAPRRMILIAGGEPRGARAELRGAADHRLRINLAAGVESLNVAVATAAVLFALRDRDPLHQP